LKGDHPRIICNFEVNLISHLGVIALFSSIFFLILILFVLYFKNYLEIDVKFKLNKGRKVLKFWKFDEKREITPKWVLGFTSKLQGG
jgi:hypothetical protein